MSKYSKLYLVDILESSKKIVAYIGTRSFEDFAKDPKTVDAVVRNLEIIGEAVKNLPAELRSSKPQINWKKIARFRDIITHHYFKINLDVVWDITQNKLSELELVVQKMIAEIDSESDPQNPK